MAETEPLRPREDIRPIVAAPPSNRALWIFGGVMGLGALALFSALEARRAEVTEPTTSATSPNAAATIAAPPPLDIPGPSQDYDPEPWPTPIVLQRISGGTPVVNPAPVPRQPVARRNGPATATYVPNYQSGPALAPQSDYSPQAAPGPAATAPSAPPSEAGRINARPFLNPATTVPQGAVLQAVLETALDSNHPGFARAIVSRDISGFDGSKVLIPRGSRLFGEYKADVSAGQNRALIQWRRLTRPDGAIIDIDSPSADPLGRAGVKGKVNSHFLERFGGALLQSVLDIGVQVATRKAAGNTVILTLPNGTTQVASVRSEEVKPTLKVREGTSVSVFVVHDLDFTSVTN